MKSKNEIVENSKAFALRIVRLYQFLTENKKEYVLSKQILRSGTSIGANIAEAQAAFSRKDFLAKMYIAFKECSETVYWLDLLFESGYIAKDGYDSLYSDAVSLRKLLSSITKSMRDNDNDETMRE
ncbi:MAG: four helix bundle protein [Synergistaceae bacterium]|nr:four helix bundle protein [Synergistaceae bacterium]